MSKGCPASEKGFFKMDIYTTEVHLHCTGMSAIIIEKHTLEKMLKRMEELENQKS